MGKRVKINDTVIFQRQIGMRNGVMIAILQRKLDYASCSLTDNDDNRISKSKEEIKKTAEEKK